MKKKSNLIQGWKGVLELIGSNISIRTLYRWNNIKPLEKIKTSKRLFLTTKENVNEWLYELNSVNTSTERP